jgi:hypothetical protein
MHGRGSPSIQVGAGTFQNLKSSGGERFVVCSVFSCQMASGEVLLLSSAPPMEERRGRVKALLPTQLNTAEELQHHWSQLTGAQMRWHTNSTFYRTTSAMGATTTSGTHRTSDGFFGTPFLRRKKRDVHPLPCTRARKLPSRTRLLRRRPPSKVGEKALPCLQAVAETKTNAVNHQHATIPSGVALFCEHESTSGLKNRSNLKFGKNCWNWVGPNLKNRRNYCSLFQNFRK